MDIEPLQGVLDVIGRGSSTGTNKYGLLLALIELAPLVGPSRMAPLSVVAEKLIEVHWEHAQPFASKGAGIEPGTLSQVTSGNRESTVLSEVARLRALLCDPTAHLPLDRARRLIPNEQWDRAVARVSKDAARNPIARLQSVDGVQHAFLYRYEQRVLTFLPGVPELLTRLGPLLRELVESRFVRQVLTSNPGLRDRAIEVDLRAHLFGSERQMPPATVRSELRRIQSGRCVYTGVDLPGRTSLDHVIPWSRSRISGLSNFVLTTPSLNSSKGDQLLAYDPLVKWLQHLTANERQLAEIGQAEAWPTHMDLTRNVIRAQYRAARPGVVLWHPHRVRPAEAGDLERILDVLGDRSPLVLGG